MRWILLLLLAVASKSTKLCINCKHFIPSIGANISPKCRLFPKFMDFSPKNIVIKRAKLVNYLVSGIPEKQEVNYLGCMAARSIDCICGIDGKFFEEKNPSSDYDRDE